MKKSRFIFVVLLINLFACKDENGKNVYGFNYKTEQLKSSYNVDSLVLYKNTKNVDERIDYNKRGIDAYHCYYDSIHGLDIRMVWGFMNGETFHLSILNDSLITNHRSWGCTSHERFDYKTIEQTLRLNTSDFANSDSLIGYLNYKGVQDVDKKIKEWDSYGKDTEWLNQLKPEIVTIEGYFKLKLFDEISDEYLKDYDRRSLSENE